MNPETFTTSSGRQGLIFGEGKEWEDPLRHVYIAPKEASYEGSGKGTRHDPLRLTWIDGKLQDFKKYVLAPGDYFTRGAWANPWRGKWSTLPMGSITTDGHEKAQIVLDEAVLRDGVEWTYAMYVGEDDKDDLLMNGSVSNILFIDLTTSSEASAVGGIYCFGDWRLSNCFAPARGCSAKNLEVFAFGSKSYGEFDALWENLSARIEDYASGFSTGIIETRDAAVTTVRNGVVFGTNAHAGIIVGSGAHFDNISVTGCTHGIYHDTEPLDGCRVVNSRFETTYTGITLARQAPEWHQRRLRVMGCDFTVNPTDPKAEAILLALVTQGKDVKPEESDWEGIRLDACTFNSKHKFPHVFSSNGGKNIPSFYGCDVPTGAKVHGPIKPNIR